MLDRSTPQALRLRSVVAAHQHLVDLPRIVQHLFHLGARFHPLVGRVELAPQPIRRPVQVTERVVQLVFLLVSGGL